MWFIQPMEEVAMDTVSQHAQLEDRNLPAGWREETRGLDCDLRCFRSSARTRRSRSRGAWRACCSCWRMQSLPTLWEWPCRRTSPRPEVTTATVTKAHRGGATSITSTWKHLWTCGYTTSGLSNLQNLMSLCSASHSVALITILQSSFFSNILFTVK